MKLGRNHTQEAIDKIRAELLRKPGQTRQSIMLATGAGIPEFQAAQKALALHCVKSYIAAQKGRMVWYVPTTTPQYVDKINVMQAPAYSGISMTAPRAGSLAYKSIQSLGMPT